MKLVVSFTTFLFFTMQYFLWFGEGGVLAVFKLQKEKRQLTQKIIEIDHEILATHDFIDEFNNSSEFVRGIVRRELGVVFKKEKFYEFPGMETKSIV